ncbi:MAG: transcription antitermination factor NusB [Treponema sp.]|nr:transcription antitermination factor NusB [Treponema sp.]
MSRRKGRILAFQALYSWDVSNESLDSILSFSWLQKDSDLNKDDSSELSVSVKDEQTFASFIINGTVSHIDEVDSLITSHLASNWSKDRLNKVTLAILRVSVYEIIFQKEAMPSIIIDEAVSIAKDYGPDDSYKFINAVLDNIGKDANKTISENKN